MFMTAAALRALRPTVAAPMLGATDEMEEAATNLACFDLRLQHALDLAWAPGLASAKAVGLLALECVGELGVAAAPRPDERELNEQHFLAALALVAVRLVDADRLAPAEKIFTWLAEQTRDPRCFNALWALSLAGRIDESRREALLEGIDGFGDDESESLLHALAESARSPQRGRAACERVLVSCVGEDVREAAATMMKAICAGEGV